MKQTERHKMKKDKTLEKLNAELDEWISSGVLDTYGPDATDEEKIRWTLENLHGLTPDQIDNEFVDMKKLFKEENDEGNKWYIQNIKYKN